MKKAIIRIPPQIHLPLHEHLLPVKYSCEEAAFLFARTPLDKELWRFEVEEWVAVPPDGFQSRSRYHLELTDHTRASVIKRAHDLELALIEIHSHAGAQPAEFSESDRVGFAEIVPHMLWRLKRRPYAALVLTMNSIDGIAWETWDDPILIESLTVPGYSAVETTRYSMQNYYGFQ